jgi:hypothetical protein
MELALETFRKTASDERSESIGHSKMVVRDASYRALARLEEALKGREQNEMMIDIDANKLQLDTPDECSDLSDCKIRLYIDEESRAGLFHVVGRQARDNSLIYTEPAMVRLIAL